MIRTSNALSLSLNGYTMTMASRLFPTGYDTSIDAPDTLERVTQQIERGRLTVYSGHSDKSIFDDETVNHDFRAWHDWTHWRYQLPFTADGERATCAKQIEHLSTLGMYADHELNVALLDIEINGQVEYSQRNGEFPLDQRGFALDQLRERGLSHLLSAKIAN